MARYPVRKTVYEAPAVCHDHFDGSAHCVECGGPCKLTGTEMAYTALVRMLFESTEFAKAKWVPGLSQLRDSGVPIEKFAERAAKCAERAGVVNGS